MERESEVEGPAQESSKGLPGEQRMGDFPEWDTADPEVMEGHLEAGTEG